jgi:hypothetical protein
MVRRRWPDVVIVIAIVLLGCTGVWAIWGRDLGLRERPKSHDEPPMRRVEGGGGMT